MNQEQLIELAGIINKHTPEEGSFDTAIPSLSFFKAFMANKIVPTVYNPSICLVVQGQKRVALHKDTYLYNISEFLIVTVDLPVLSTITQASENKPYLALKLDIELPILSELLFNMEYSAPPGDVDNRGLFIAKADQTTGDSILRLLRMLDEPQDISLLAVQTIREIFYRILRSEFSDMLAQIAFKGSHVERITSAIRKIKLDFRESMNVEELAKLAGMSVSGFYAHFKSITAMSPLQFQKQLRLIEARNLMLMENKDAAAAAYQVGYESASQFSREYARIFGNPPGRDIHLLKGSQYDNITLAPESIDS